MTHNEWLEEVQRDYRPETHFSYTTNGHPWDVLFSDSKKYVFVVYDEQCARWEYDWIDHTEVIDKVSQDVEHRVNPHKGRTFGIAALGALFGWFVYADQSKRETKVYETHAYTLRVHFANAPAPYSDILFLDDADVMLQVKAKIDQLAKVSCGKATRGTTGRGTVQNSVLEDVMDAVNKNQIIMAVKIYMDYKHCGLKEAKDFVDKLRTIK